MQIQSGASRLFQDFLVFFFWVARACLGSSYFQYLHGANLPKYYLQNLATDRMPHCAHVHNKFMHVGRIVFLPISSFLRPSFDLHCGLLVLSVRPLSSSLWSTKDWTKASITEEKEGDNFCRPTSNVANANAASHSFPVARRQLVVAAAARWHRVSSILENGVSYQEFF